MTGSLQEPSVKTFAGHVLLELRVPYPLVFSSSCSSDTECTSESFCKLPTGACTTGATERIGVCTPVPQICTLDYRPGLLGFSLVIF